MEHKDNLLQIVTNMNSENSNNEFTFPQSLTSPLADQFNTSYIDNSYPMCLKEDNSVEFQTQDLSTPMLPYCTIKSHDGLDHESYFKVNKNSVECTANALENGASNSENPFINISQSVDDYSLYYVLSSGSRYCASLKESQQGNNSISTGDGNPSNNQVKPIHPVLTSSNEVDGDGYGGGIFKSPLGEHYKTPLQHYQAFSHESSKYPEISRYAGKLQTFLRGTPRPQKKGKTVEFKCKEEPVWDFDMESTKFQSKSSMKNFIPSYCENELKEVSKNEYRTTLRRKSKDISKGSSTRRGVSKFSKKLSDEDKWKAILWTAQDCKEPAQASDIPAIRLSGTEKGLQINDNMDGGHGNEGIQRAGHNQTFQFYLNDNFAKQALDKNSSSSQFSQGFQKSEVQTHPSFTYGGCSKDVNAKGSFIMLDNEEDIISEIWKECDPLSPLGEDCYILPAASLNKDFHFHDQNKSCTNQDGSNQGFTNGKLNLDSTIIETVKAPTKGGNTDESSIEGLIAQEDSLQLKCSEIEDVDIFKLDQAELNFSSDIWTNDLLFPTDLFGNDKK